MNSQRTRSPTAGSSTVGRRGSHVNVIPLTLLSLDNCVDDGEKRVAYGGRDPARRHDDRAEPARQLDHLGHDRRTLDVVSVEDIFRGLSSQDCDELPRQVDRIFHASIHTLPCEGRHQMRGVARQEHAANPPPIGDARMESVDGLALDLKGVDPGLALDECADVLVPLELILPSRPPGSSSRAGPFPPSPSKR